MPGRLQRLPRKAAGLTLATQAESASICPPLAKMWLLAEAAQVHACLRRASALQFVVQDYIEPTDSYNPALAANLGRKGECKATCLRIERPTQLH